MHVEIIKNNVIINIKFLELVFISDWWAGTQYYFYADKEDYKYFGKEHAVFILNHKYEIDWLAAWAINDRIGILGVSFSSQI